MSTQCYKFLLGADERNWQDARSYCQNQGGNLVSILNYREQGKLHFSFCDSWIITVLCYFVAVVLFFCSLAFLTTQMLKFKESLWIGMNDVNWEMRFVWTDGKGIGFTNWAKGHPVSVPRGRNTYNDEVTSRSPPLFSAGLSAFPPPQRRRQSEAKRIHENDENLFE